MSLGRLYWKFFFFILLAQLTAVVGVAGIFWLERQQDHARWAAAAGVAPPDGAPGMEGPPSHDGRPPQGSPPPPHDQRLASGAQPPPPPGGEPPADRRPPPVDGEFRPHHGGHRLPGAPNHLPLVPVGVGLLASFVFAALLAWYFSKPIRSLRAAFDAASAGNLEVRASPAMGGRRDELADLGRDFDRMAVRLRDLLDAQRRLLHDVSHELRSPLARLQAF